MKISFKNGIAYKLDYFAGVANVIFTIIVNIMLWKTLYEGQNLENSVQHKIMTTYVILSTIIQTAFIMDEFTIENKIRDGSIIHYLMKPISFRLYTFSNTLGRLFFNLIMLLIPAVIIMKLVCDILVPYSLSYFIYFIITSILGYLVLYNINFLVWTFAFENITSWGLITLKNALIVVLSGALIPLYLMPDSVAKIVEYLPFQTIYYFPLSIYLGIIPESDIFSGILIQLVWIGVFAFIGHLLWKRSIKEVVVQGG
jgi:ABC-2 type transport system permease protein